MPFVVKKINSKDQEISLVLVNVYDVNNNTQVAGLDVRALKVKSPQQFLLYWYGIFLLNKYLNATICHIIMARPHHLLPY